MVIDDVVEDEVIAVVLSLVVGRGDVTIIVNSVGVLAAKEKIAQNWVNFVGQLMIV